MNKIEHEGKMYGTIVRTMMEPFTLYFIYLCIPRESEILLVDDLKHSSGFNRLV